MPAFSVELSQKEVEKIVREYITDKLGDGNVVNVHFLVKSKQNYKSTWEEAGIVVTSKPEDYIPEFKAQAEIG